MISLDEMHSTTENAYVYAILYVRTYRQSTYVYWCICTVCAVLHSYTHAYTSRMQTHMCTHTHMHTSTHMHMNTQLRIMVSFNYK